MKNRKTTKRQRREHRQAAEFKNVLQKERARQAVQDLPISYADKQRLAEIYRKRERLVARFSADHGKYAAEQPLKSSNGSTGMAGKTWMRASEKKWDDAYAPYAEPSTPRLVNGRWQVVPSARNH